jgi:hypothetical protein
MTKSSIFVALKAIAPVLIAVTILITILDFEFLTIKRCGVRINVDPSQLPITH